MATTRQWNWFLSHCNGWNTSEIQIMVLCSHVRFTNATCYMVCSCSINLCLQPNTPVFLELDGGPEWTSHCSLSAPTHVYSPSPRFIGFICCGLTFCNSAAKFGMSLPAVWFSLHFDLPFLSPVSFIVGNRFEITKHLMTPLHVRNKSETPSRGIWSSTSIKTIFLSAAPQSLSSV